MISAVAEMYNIHPQTLRLYEREGLLIPSRSNGNTRLYTQEDLEHLETILRVVRRPLLEHQQDPRSPCVLGTPTPRPHPTLQYSS